MRITAALLLVACFAVADGKKVDALKERIAAVDAAIAKEAKENTTALGAKKLEDLRTLREKLALELRELEEAAKEKKEIEVPDISKLIEMAKKGDAGARTALLRLKARIEQAVLGNEQPPRQGQVVMFGNGQRLVVRGRAVGLGGPVTVVNGKPASKPEPEKKVKEISEEEKKRLAEIDIEDQERRAAELERTIIELTRRALELERRIEDLRARAAAAEAR